MNLIRNLLRWFQSLWIDANLRHPWRAIRYQGGGTLTSPKDMTEQEAVDWVSKIGEIMFIDREHGFIFYRAK